MAEGIPERVKLSKDILKENDPFTARVFETGKPLRVHKNNDGQYVDQDGKPYKLNDKDQRT